MGSKYKFAHSLRDINTFQQHIIQAVPLKRKVIAQMSKTCEVFVYIYIYIYFVSFYWKLTTSAINKTDYWNIKCCFSLIKKTFNMLISMISFHYALFHTPNQKPFKEPRSLFDNIIYTEYVVFISNYPWFLYPILLPLVCENNRLFVSVAVFVCVFFLLMCCDVWCIRHVRICVSAL